mgnify:CR=1 FL=1
MLKIIQLFATNFVIFFVVGKKNMKKNVFICLFAITCVAMMSCGGSSNKEQKGQGTLVALAQSDDSEGLIYIDIDGKRIISDPRFSRGERFSEGLAAVYDKETGNIGFIDIKGNLVIPCELPNSHSWVSFNEKEIIQKEKDSAATQVNVHYQI